ncbi:ricin-type beta-trefoil lectin domain protein, partial [Streptomyces sp. NPDC059766]|uniref:ricin-type beta-trefoil lectin domain protein n=1 Tax=Streptomyces sp. NPDC059766 TaxID=3346940 RepID=UPI00366655DC
MLLRDLQLLHPASLSGLVPRKTLSHVRAICLSCALRSADLTSLLLRASTCGWGDTAATSAMSAASDSSDGTPVCPFPMKDAALKSRPGFLTPALQRPGYLARAVLPLLALAVLATFTTRPELAGRSGGSTSLVADSYDGFDAKGAAQLRLDQCLMADVLRQGGPNMFALAKDSLVLPADQLHQKADRGYPGTPFAQAYDKDHDTTDEWVKKAGDRPLAWQNAISGLYDYPDSPGDETKIFDRTGLLPWLYQAYMGGLGFFFYDPTPSADTKTTDAVVALGDQLYGSSGTSAAESDAWKLWKRHAAETPPRSYADDSRLFLASGGFPRTATQPGTAEFRLAVEDLKTRFASCAWRTPVDPNTVLGKEVAAASAEWQQEIASQVTQRQQILTANSQAVKALQDGSFALGEILGQAWIADYTTRWQDYWSAGGVGWIGDSPMVIHAHGATDKCLEAQGGKTADGTPVQIYTCNSTAAQKWQISDDALVNVNSGKCLDIKGNGTVNGTALQLLACNNQSAAQKWVYNTHATTRLYNPGTGNCVDLATYDNGRDGRMWDCKGTDPQKFDIAPSGHNGTDKSYYPTKVQFDKAKKAVPDAQAAAKKQLDLIKAQAAVAQTAVADTDTATKAAYAIADAAGAPRGRGLLVGQQKAQVTKASAAALEALSKAGDTAYAATRAAAGDSETIAARALTPAAPSKAACRTAAAHEAK